MWPSLATTRSFSFFPLRRLFTMASSRTTQDLHACLLSLQSNSASIEAQRKERGSPHNEQCLAEMQNYLKRCDIDVDKLPVLHVAGTKGKGSTCAFAESILRAHGLRTGLYTSPHLADVKERFRINGEIIGQESFSDSFWSVWDALNNTKDQTLEGMQPLPMYFRFLTIVGFHLFLKENVNALVLEVGLGGRLDATNAVRTPIVTAITSLGLDHTSVLGNTIGAIAREKAGIIKEGVPLFTAPQPQEAMDVIDSVALALNAPKKVIEPLNPSIPIGIAGDHQRINASVAVYITDTFLRKEQAERPVLDLNALSDTMLQGLKDTRWLGRSTVIPSPTTPNLKFYLDGAHSPESCDACASWFTEASHDSSTTLVFNVANTREPEKLLTSLAVLPFKTVIFTTNKTNEELRAIKDGGPSASSTYSVLIDGEMKDLEWQHHLQDVWKGMTTQKDQQMLVLPTVTDALAKAAELASSSSLQHSCLVTGSLYLVGGALQSLSAI